MKNLIVRLMLPLLAVLLLTSSVMSVAGQDSTPLASPDADEFVESRAISFYPEESGAGTFISVELSPGESVDVNVVLGNSGNVQQTLRTYTVNALSSANGGFALAEYGTEVSGASLWVDYPAEEYTFAPSEGIQIPITISVPDDAAPGEYVTSLAAEQAEPFEIPGSTMLNQRIRWSLPILITVPGERAPAFELGDAELKWVDGGVYATVDIVNTGNVTVKPSGEVRLLDAEGQVIGVSSVEMGSVYQGTETVFITGWPNTPESDSYSIGVVLSAEDGAATSTQTYTALVPIDENADSPEAEPLEFSHAGFTNSNDEAPPSLLNFEGEITNNAEPIENARVSIVTYKDGIEVDRYPIMQAVTIGQGTTPVEARYSLPGGFTDGTYTFEVTIEIGDAGTQTVLVTQPIDYEVVVGD